MDRKNFIKTSGLGLGISLIPFGFTRKVKASATSKIESSKPKIMKDAEGSVLNVIGDIQTHKLLGSDTANQIVEWVDNVAPGVGIPPHIHTKEDEIFRVIKGQIEIMVDGKATVLNPGDIAFAPKNIAHSWKVIGTEKAKLITSAFPAGIEHMFTEIAQLPEGPPNFDLVFKICGKYGVSFV